jgi:hypothetical protein
LAWLSALVVGWSNWPTVVLAVMLAFLFGYGMPLWPLRRVGMACGTALGLAFASDTLSMATMELVDNTIMLVDHEKANKLLMFNDNGKTCGTSSGSNHWPMLLLISGPYA